MKFPDSEKEKGLMKFAPIPIGNAEHLIIKLWDKYTPGWNRREEKPVTLTPETEKKLVKHLRKFTDAPTINTNAGMNDDIDLDQMAIQRMVPKHKGSWWLLPKDLKVEGD